MPTTKMETMRAIVQDGYGAPQRVLRPDRIARPPVGPRDVLVRVRATSVNTPDWITVAGVPYVLRLKSGLRRPSHPVRGSDVAGVVEEVGHDVADLHPGDEVFGSVWDSTIGARAGTFAEYTVVPASQLVRKPAGLSFAEAAASVMTGLTAHIAMSDVGRVRSGTRVLVNGSSGGVGTMAVQFAASLGADVTAVCSSRNVDLVRSLGAHQVIDYTKEDYAGGRRRHDVILDNVMNRSPWATARALAPGGVLIPNSIGNSGGLLAGLPRIASAGVMGLGATTVKTVRLEVNRENLTALADLLESGGVRVVIDRTYPLEHAGDAVEHVLRHHARGKVVITV